MSTQVDAPRQLQERGKLLIALLRKGKSEHQRSILLWGGLHLLATLVLVAVVLLGLSALAPILPRPAGVGLSLFLWGLIGFLVWRHWIRPLRAVPNLAVFSRLIEERRDFRDMLRAALEFSQKGAPQGGSVDLAAATVDRAYDEARSLSLTQLFEFPHKRRDALLVVLGVAALGLGMLGAPTISQRALSSMAFAYPSPASIVYGSLEVLGGDVQVLSGEDVVVRVRDHGPLAPEMHLRFNDTGDLWKTRKLEPLGNVSPHEYAFRFEGVRDNTSYRFESGKRRTAEHQIQVVQLPILNRFSLRLIPPSYTRRDPVTLEEGRGDAIALLGTEIEIQGTCSTTLRRASLVPEGDETGAVTLPKPQAMEIEGAQFKTTITLRGDLRYHFEVQDENGYKNSDPVIYQISSIEDRTPYVELRQPEGDASIPKSMRVPMVLYASDDFGVSRMTIVYRHEREGEDLGNSEQRLDLQLHGKTAVDADGAPLGKEPAPEVVKTFEWDLSSIRLFPGDYLTYYIEVEDNDEFSGHKTARTPDYKLRLPTLGELYAKIQEKDDNRMSELEDVLEKGREVHEKFEKMARELKKNPEMDWKKEQEIDKAIEKQKELAKKVEELAKDLDREIQRMEQQELVSREIAEKMEEIRKLMEQVESDTMREYMERLQEAMKQISPEEIQRAMEEMQLSQEEFLKRLERTKNLLEQLRREQELDALVERTSELLERQEELTERTKELEEKMQGDEQDKESSETKNDNQQEGDETQANEQESERLAQEQSDLAEETEKLQEDLEKLSEEMQQNGQQELNEAQESMEQQQPSEDMQEASEQLQQQQPQQAQPNQQSAERRLRALYEQLMNAQMQMSMNMQAEAAEALQKAARQSLDVSFRQEHLSREVAPMGDYESTGDLARGQQSLKAAAGKIVDDLDDMAQKSLMIPPQITQLLGQAILKMDEGVEAYEKGNGLAGRVRGEEAYADLNRVVIELNRSAKSCMGGGGGMSQSSSQQRMGQMMEQQQRLNDATRQFAERLPNPGNLSPEERGELSRLMGEQQSIQQELNEIERQAAEQRDLLGRLDKMQGEMKEVIEDMDSEYVSEETLRMQERIVSRMLQAQRSLHKRDYNKERESRAAEEIYSEGGDELPESDDLKKLRRDIQRALESGTPEEYQELVRQYFRSIAEPEEVKKEVP